jgi:RND family efflux transporter MFP subunit
MIRWKIIGISLVLLVLAGSAACNPFGGDEEEVSQQLVEVVRGDLTITVSGSGNVKASREARLSFGSGGRVAQILVKEGDWVSQGEVLAKLDTKSLELAKTQAEVALSQAEVALSQAKLTQQTAEFELETTLDKKDSLELALLNAQIALKTAKYNLDVAKDVYRWPEVEEAQAEVDKAKSLVQYAIDGLANATTDAERATWSNFLARAQANLDAVEAKLKAQLAGYDTEEVAIKKMEVQAAEMAVAQAQKNLDQLAEEIALKELKVEAAKLSVAQAQHSVELAQKSLEEAQRQLDEAVLTAPFAGVIAGVYVKEGDLIPTPTMAPKPIIYLIDPAQMELIIELDEIDVPEVKLGQEAVISIDALPDKEFIGKITAIFPLPIEEGGVVLYNVKINFDVSEHSPVKIGMSATADIIIDKRSNVLLVPDRAIQKDSQGNPVVKVMINGQIQERQVVTGISDGLKTEILSGLREGEVVVIETKTKPKKETEIGFL